MGPFFRWSTTSRFVIHTLPSHLESLNPKIPYLINTKQRCKIATSIPSGTVWNNVDSCVCSSDISMCEFLTVVIAVCNVSQTGCTIASQLGFEPCSLIWRAGSLPIKPSGMANCYKISHMCSQNTFGNMCMQFWRHSVTTRGEWLANAKFLKYPSYVEISL